MILKTLRGNKRAVGEWGDSWRIPEPGAQAVSQSGVFVGEETAYGLPAVTNVIRSPSELIAAMPFMTYEKGTVPALRDRREDTWQWDLFHEKPNDEIDPYQFFYDVNVSIEASQNAFIQKVKARGGQVVALYVIDPQRVMDLRKNF